MIETELQTTCIKVQQKGHDHLKAFRRKYEKRRRHVYKRHVKRDRAMKKKKVNLPIIGTLTRIFSIRNQIRDFSTFTLSNIFQPTSCFTQSLHITPISYQTNSLLVPISRKFSSKFQILQRTLRKLTAQD